MNPQIQVAKVLNLYKPIDLYLWNDGIYRTEKEPLPKKEFEEVRVRGFPKDFNIFIQNSYLNDGILYKDYIINQMNHNTGK